MKTQLVIFGLLIFSITACQSQVSTHEDQSKKEPVPREKVIVNKTYDEDGNLLAMDSVYTYYYSNMEGDSLLADSVLGNFSLYFNDNFPGLAANHFFNEDSDFRSDFFHHDYFERNFMKQDEELLKFMQEMDSLKNMYFQHFSQQNNIME